MQTKLTLRLDQQLIDVAKKTAAKRGISVSRMVANYFAGLRQVNRQEGKQLPPLTASLIGVVKGTHPDEKSYREHLARKHR